MYQSKRHQRIKREEEIRTGPSVRREPCRPLVDEVWPPGARLVWDESTGNLMVRVPKARWK